jgi:putative addiction module CopG family antidote
MNVSLTNKLEGFVNELVEQGRYRSASEVVCEGLRLMGRAKGGMSLRHGLKLVCRG